MVYSYYDYLENYYDYYYEYVYWPNYYNGTNYNGTYPPFSYTPPYQMSYITPPIFTVSVLCAISAIIITLLICWKIYHGKNRNKITITLTLLCAFTHLCQNIIDPITYYTWFIQFNPKINKSMYLFYDIFWCLAKISLYLLFIHRYYVILKASAGTTQTQKYTIFICFTITMTTQCVLYICYMSLRWELIEYEDKETGKRIWMNVCWSFLVIDLLLIGILGCLLAHSILKLIMFINKLDSKSSIEISIRPSYFSKIGSSSVSITGASSNVRDENKLAEIISHQKQVTASEMKTNTSDNVFGEYNKIRTFLEDNKLDVDDMFSRMHGNGVK
eukprot:363654_1